MTIKNLQFCFVSNKNVASFACIWSPFLCQEAYVSFLGELVNIFFFNCLFLFSITPPFFLDNVTLP